MMRLYRFHEMAVAASVQLPPDRPDREMPWDAYRHTGGRKPKGKKPTRTNPARKEKLSFN
jgi:hypothetical protein